MICPLKVKEEKRRLPEKRNEIVICASRPKVHLFRPNVSFLTEAQPRLDNMREQKAKRIKNRNADEN
jgi:hypothetical protein